jgi:hypothetical protein
MEKSFKFHLPLIWLLVSFVVVFINKLFLIFIIFCYKLIFLLIDCLFFLVDDVFVVRVSVDSARIFAIFFSIPNKEKKLKWSDKVVLWNHL